MPFCRTVDVYQGSQGNCYALTFYLLFWKKGAAHHLYKRRPTYGLPSYGLALLADSGGVVLVDGSSINIKL